jgi:hypothetical protein
MSEMNTNPQSEMPDAEMKAEAIELVAPVDDVTPEQPEETVSEAEGKNMIDVHAPHHPVTTWKDFFIHIAVVTIGLLLAILLEQTVEYFHHRNQVAEIREALRIERKINIVRYQLETREMRRFVPELKLNLAIYQYLRQHPGAPPEKWPGTFHLYSLSTNYTDAVWRTAENSNVLQYMPQAEVRRLTGFYNNLKTLNDMNATKVDEKRESFRFFIQNADASKFTPEQLDRAIDLTTETILLHAKEANLMSNLAHGNADFTDGPTTEDYSAILQLAPTPEDKKIVMSESAESVKREKEIMNGSAEDASDPGK